MNERGFLIQIMKGYEPAVTFCELLGVISQTWDDLVDQDRAVDPNEVNRAFFSAVIELPANAFYQANFANLHPLIQAAVYDWLASNELALGSQHDRSLAFVLRDGLVAVVIQCAYLVGGHAWAIEQSPIIRRFYHDETIEQYSGGAV